MSADLGEQFFDKALLEVPRRTGFNRQSGKLAGSNSVLEIGHAKAGDRRYEDQYFADHQEKEGQDEETGGQAVHKHAGRPL